MLLLTLAHPAKVRLTLALTTFYRSWARNRPLATHIPIFLLLLILLFSSPLFLLLLVDVTKDSTDYSQERTRSQDR